VTHTCSSSTWPVVHVSMCVIWDVVALHMTCLACRHVFHMARDLTCMSHVLHVCHMPLRLDLPCMSRRVWYGM